MPGSTSKRKPPNCSLAPKHCYLTPRALPQRGTPQGRTRCSRPPNHDGPRSPLGMSPTRSRSGVGSHLTPGAIILLQKPAPRDFERVARMACLAGRTKASIAALCWAHTAIKSFWGQRCFHTANLCDGKQQVRAIHDTIPVYWSATRIALVPLPEATLGERLLANPASVVRPVRLRRRRRRRR